MPIKRQLNEQKLLYILFLSLQIKNICIYKIMKCKIQKIMILSSRQKGQQTYLFEQILLKMYFVYARLFIKIDQICFVFIILFAVLMNLIERMLDNISQKQEETTSNLEQAFRRLLSSNGKEFMTKLADKLTDHFEESLSKHSNKIGLFLFSQNANNEQFLIQEQQPISINVLPQQKNPQTEKHIEAKINVQNVASNEQSKKRKEIIEKEKGIDQNPELKNEYNNKKNKQLQFLEQSNPSQQFTNQKIIEANNDKKSKNFSIKQKDRTPSLHHKQLATNGKLGKSNSRKNGQSRKSFQEENFKSRGKSYKQKSRKMRTNLIKLAPIAQAKQRQTKRKEANERIQAALEFLNSLPSKKNAISFSPTQWKQQKSEKFILSKNNASMSPNSIKLKELSQKSRLQKSRKLESNILQMSDFSPKQHRMQKRDRFSLQKPQAYNLYNINMLKHEVFQLRVSD